MKHGSSMVGENEKVRGRRVLVLVPPPPRPLPLPPPPLLSPRPPPRGPAVTLTVFAACCIPFAQEV